MNTQNYKVKRVLLVTEVFPALNSLGQLTILDVPLMVSTAKNIKVAKDEFELTQELRRKIGTEQAIIDEATGEAKVENGCYVYPDKKTEKAVSERLKELENEEVQLAFYPIEEDKIDKIKDFKAGTLSALMFMVK